MLRLAGTWVVGIFTIAGLFVIAKDQQVVDTLWTDATKMLATAMGGNAFG